MQSTKPKPYKTKAAKRGNYAFIDSQNLNLGVQKLGWKMDWRRFRKYLNDKYGITQAFMFIGYMPENEDMYVQLHDAGYLVVLKPTQDLTRVQVPQTGEESPEDKKPIKGNIDAELVLWAVKEMDRYDRAVIVSGDGDFYSLVEYLEENNKLLKLLVPNRHYSNLYSKYADYIDRIDVLKHELQYHDGKHYRRTTKSPKS